jgi:hypothetical protein
MGIPEGKKPRGRSRGIREDNFKMDLLELYGGASIISVWLRIRIRGLAVVNMVMNFQVP